MKHAFALFILTVAILSGCSILERDSAAEAPLPAQIVVDYDAQALSSYRQARQFIAQGRYELAREQYLIALAIARNESMREQVKQELQATDLMLRAAR